MRVSQLSCAESGRGFGSSRDHDCKQNKIHDVTMYNDSSQSNALNTLDSEILRMRISKKRSEYCKKISPALNILTIMHANFTLAERRKTRTECK